MPEIEAVRGAAERILPLVRFPVLMRVILPGAFATALVYPFTGLKIDFFDPHFLEHWQAPLLVVAMLFVFGALLSAVNGEVYKVYEGRVLWPPRLRESWVRRQQKRVEKLREAAEEAKKAKRDAERAEIWYQLRSYPRNVQGAPYAAYPTLLGNILKGYEDYSGDRYGMDSIFYWPRLWLQMDKEKKEEIDSSWSVADGFLSLSAVSFIGGAGWALAAALDEWGFLARLPSTTSKTFIIGLLLIAIGYAIYRLSLPFHRQNGETFKSIFDLYRDKVWSLTSLKPKEAAAWHATWAYLQYGMVHCIHCGTLNRVTLEKCQQCGKPVEDSVAKLRESGQFPLKQS